MIGRLGLDAFISFAKVLYARSINVYKAAEALERSDMEALIQLIEHSPRSWILAKRLPEEAEEAFLRDLDAELSELEKLAPSIAKSIVSLTFADIDLANLALYIQGKEDKALPIGYVYRMCISQGMDVERCAKELSKRLGIEIDLNRVRKEGLVAFDKARIHVFAKLIDVVDTSRLYLHAPTCVREWVALRLAEILSVTKALGYVDDIRSEIRRVLGVGEEDVERIPRYIAKPISAQFDAVVRNIFQKPLSASVSVALYTCKSILPKLFIPGTDLDVVLGISLLKLYEMMFIRMVLAYRLGGINVYTQA